MKKFLLTLIALVVAFIATAQIETTEYNAMTTLYYNPTTGDYDFHDPEQIRDYSVTINEEERSIDINYDIENNREGEYHICCITFIEKRTIHGLTISQYIGLFDRYEVEILIADGIINITNIPAGIKYAMYNKRE